MRGITIALFIVAAAANCQGAVVFFVDLSDPSAAVISSTAANSESNDSLGVQTGVTLIDFLDGELSQFTPIDISGNLTPRGSAEVYGDAFIDEYDGDKSFDSLNLYTNFSVEDQIFSTTERAFTGGAILDLSSVVAFLPAEGTTGSVRAGDYGTPGAVVGQWRVTEAIPEPGHFAALLALFAVVSLMLRRRR